MNDDNRSILVAHCGAHKVTRDELVDLPMPEGTKTHKPLSHYGVVQALEEALNYRYLKVLKEEYAVSADGMKMFGLMELNYEFGGCRFSIGLRNSNDKSMRLALTAGYRVFVCDNMAFSGDFTPLSHKHTNNLQLQDAISIAVDRIHRGFEPLKARVQEMRDLALSEQSVKLLIYEAFLDRKLKGIPRQLMPIVHDHYFHPKHESFVPRNMWSLSNAFTSALKKLGPVKQFEVTARLGAFLSEAQNDLGPKPKTAAVPVDVGRIVLFGQPRPALALGASNSAVANSTRNLVKNFPDGEGNLNSEWNNNNEENFDNYPWDTINDNDQFDEEPDFQELTDLEEELDNEYLRKIN
jgi:hypothetical protein